MKINAIRYEELIGKEERLNVLQDMLDSEAMGDRLDAEEICCILGLSAIRYREKKKRKEEELLAWTAARKGGNDNGDTV